MKRLIIILTILIITINSYSQNNCNIIQEYSNIFKIERKIYGEHEYLYISVNKLEKNNCFSDLVNDNPQYIDYLRLNFANNIMDTLETINDSIKLQNEFINLLQKDSSFNNIMIRLSNKTLKKTEFIPDTVSLDKLLNIAVKFFSIIKITDEGYYVGKVCAGINSLDQTEKERKPHIEAFCFSTILTNYQNEQFNIYNEFVKSIKELYIINLGIDKNDRLLRAQGAMFMLMRNNDILRELLIFEYQQKKDYLPFVLIIN